MPLSYFPPGSETTRVCWYGGDSTQLHYEVRRDNEWSGVVTKTLMDMPTNVKELSHKMVEFYNDCV
jgi:hypothetical protein